MGRATPGNTVRDSICVVTSDQPPPQIRQGTRRQPLYNTTGRFENKICISKTTGVIQTKLYKMYRKIALIELSILLYILFAYVLYSN